MTSNPNPNLNLSPNPSPNPSADLLLTIISEKTAVLEALRLVLVEATQKQFKGRALAAIAAAIAEGEAELEEIVEEFNKASR